MRLFRRKRKRRKRRQLFRDIYLLWSPRYGHKIGISNKAIRRVSEIKEDGLPGVVILVGSFRVWDAVKFEDRLHKRFDRYRYTIRPDVSGRTEFFRLGGKGFRLPIVSYLLGFLRAIYIWVVMFTAMLFQYMFLLALVIGFVYLAIRIL